MYSSRGDGWTVRVGGQTEVSGESQSEVGVSFGERVWRESMDPGWGCGVGRAVDRRAKSLDAPRRLPS